MFIYLMCKCVEVRGHPVGGGQSFSPTVWTMGLNSTHAASLEIRHHRLSHLAGPFCFYSFFLNFILWRLTLLYVAVFNSQVNLNREIRETLLLWEGRRHTLEPVPPSLCLVPET